MRSSLGILAACFSLLTRLPPLVGGAATNTTRSIVSHSLPESYKFDSRDGWDSVIVTNLRYKYRRSPAPLPAVPSEEKMGTNTSSALKRPLSTNAEHSSIRSVLRSVGKSIAELTKGIIATGDPEPVTITWYTGHDLLNPSCWTKPEWAPTDNSFVAALTLDGWSEKPKCFKFIEICNITTKNCTFVRVVDTCAGCKKGSKHVDLTRAAFEKLAPLDTGILTAQMRVASEPTDWDIDLWGPKDN